MPEKFSRQRQRCGMRKDLKYLKYPARTTLFFFKCTGMVAVPLFLTTVKSLLIISGSIGDTRQQQQKQSGIETLNLPRKHPESINQIETALNNFQQSFKEQWELKPFYSSELSMTSQQRPISGMSDWQITITHIINSSLWNSIMQVQRSRNSFCSQQSTFSVFVSTAHLLALFHTL